MRAVNARPKRPLNRRHIQVLSLVLANAYFVPFLRFLPYPFLHCYACPLAIGACPIGSLQHFIILGQFPLYLTGALGLVGALWGRTVCGYLCPFGFIQDLLHRLPGPKFSVANRHTWTRWVSLVGLVGVASYVLQEPWFCKLCPEGMLTGGLPVVATRSELWPLVGPAYVVKAVILLVVLAAMVFIKRPFCRFICPLGLIFGLFNKIGGRPYKVEKDRCNGCGWCRRACPVDLNPAEAAGTSLCLKCGECLKCPAWVIGQ